MTFEELCDNGQQTMVATLLWDLHEPDNIKRLKMYVFGSYSKIRSQTQIAAPKKNVVPIADLVQRYLSCVDTISHTQQEAGTLPWSLIQSNAEYAPLKPLFEYVYSAPCTSAPVERIFSHGGHFYVAAQGVNEWQSIMWHDPI